MPRKRGDAAASIQANEAPKAPPLKSGPRRRASPEVKAERAVTALDNPAVREAFDVQRASIILEMERAVLDGSQKSADTALELVRQLQTLLELKRVMLRPVTTQLLKRSRRDMQ